MGSRMGDEKCVYERVLVLQEQMDVWSDDIFILVGRRGIVNDEETLHAPRRRRVGRVQLDERLALDNYIVFNFKQLK